MPRAAAELAWIAGQRRHGRGAIAATVAATVQTTKRPLPNARDLLERELPLLVVAERVEVLLARELDHGRRAAHDDEC